MKPNKHISFILSSCSFFFWKLSVNVILAIAVFSKAIHVRTENQPFKLKYQWDFRISQNKRCSLIRIRNQKDFVKRKIKLSQIPEIDNSHPIPT